jgi:hypothetical protein
MMLYSRNLLETPDIETSSAEYAKRFSGKIGAWFLKIQAETTVRMLAAYPNASVLDVGGGHGQITNALVSNGGKITIFGSAASCSQRIQRFVDEGRCSFEVGNILELPYPDRNFEVVVSYRLLPHVVQWKRLISELTRVAEKAVIVDYPSVRSLNYLAPLLFGFKKQLEGNTRPFACFDERELLGEFRAFEFTPAERYPEFFCRWFCIVF